MGGCGARFAETTAGKGVAHLACVERGSKCDFCRQRSVKGDNCQSDTVTDLVVICKYI